MKTKFVVLMATIMLSQVVQADQSKAIVLKDGTTARVYEQSGKFTGYLKSADAGADGKPVLVPGEVFDGTRLAKLADGRCVRVVERFVRMEDVAVAGGKIQRPVTQRTEEAVACGSKLNAP